jgi:hypothetical protein
MKSMADLEGKKATIVFSDPKRGLVDYQCDVVRTPSATGDSLHVVIDDEDHFINTASSGYHSLIALQDKAPFDTKPLMNIQYEAEARKEPDNELKCMLTSAEFRVLLELVMVSHPWPLDKGADVIKKLLDSEAQIREYDGWIDAYHKLYGQEATIEQSAWWEKPYFVHNKRNWKKIQPPWHDEKLQEMLSENAFGTWMHHGVAGVYYLENLKFGKLWELKYVEQDHWVSLGKSQGVLKALQVVDAEEAKLQAAK